MGFQQLTLDSNNFTITSELQSDQLVIQNLENITDPDTVNTTIIDGSDGGLQNNGSITIRYMFNSPQFLNKVSIRWGNDNGADAKLFFYDSMGNKVGGEIASFDDSNSEQSGVFVQPTINPIRIQYFEIVLTGGSSNLEDSGGVIIAVVKAFIPDNLHEYSFKDYNIEFNDSLLDMASWNNPRYEGSKLTGAQVNYYNDSDGVYPFGPNPIVENKISAIFVGSSIQTPTEATNSLESLVQIKNHSYITINEVLLINRETKEVESISFEQFNETAKKRESFRRLITDSFPEGSKIVTKIIDNGVPSLLKENHRIKFNQGLLMKIYAYTANIEGHEDGVFGGFGVRDQKGSLTLNIASGSEAIRPTIGGGLFGFGMTAIESRSLFTTNSISTVNEIPSELSLYGESIGIISSLNPATASLAQSTITEGTHEYLEANQKE